MAPTIKLYFLQASRSIRTAWLLEALNLEYEVIFSPRVNKVAPPEFKKQAGGLGKFPTLVDGDLVITESGNITEYICDTYDKSHKFLPAPGDPKRYQVLQWIHSSEGLFALHALAIMYARWFQKDGSVETTEQGMAGNLLKDLDYLEDHLNKQEGEWLCGNSLSAADMMLHFVVTFVLARELGTKGKQWPRINRWVEACEKENSFQKAVSRTGYDLSQSG